MNLPARTPPKNPPGKPRFRTIESVELLRDRYRLLEKIGEGGMAEVWKARDERIGREVAVKLLYAHVHPSEQGRFQQEIRALSRLHHPGVVHIYDLGETGGRTYFVMELVEGGSIVQLGPYEHGQEGLLLLRVSHQVLDALDYLHRSGILHRDLTPKNILLSRENHPKIMDFGLAYMADVTRHFTRTGYTLGTPQYMAPEQAKGHPLTPQADLYSLGVLLYRALTGTAPFAGENDQAILYQHVYEAPPSPQDYNPAIPEAVARLVLELLAKEPEDRPSSAAAARLRLEQILRQVTESLHATARSGFSRSGHAPTGPAEPARLKAAGRLKLEGEVAWPAELVAREGLLALGSTAGRLALIRTQPLRLEEVLPATDEVTAPALLSDQRAYYAAWDGKLRAYDLEQGQLAFECTSGAKITASPLKVAGRLYLAGRDGYLYAYADSGKLLWVFEAGGQLSAGPTLYRKQLFVASENGWLFALEPGSGHLRYKVETGPIHAHLAAAEGVLVVPTWAGEVHGFDPVAMEVMWTFDIESGIWDSPAAGQGRVYVGGWDGGLYALDLHSGNELWVKETGRLTAGPVLAGGYLYVADEGGLLLALRADTGEEVWRVEGLGPVQAAPFPYHQSLFVATLAGELHAFRESD